MNEDADFSNQPLEFDPATLPANVTALPEPARQAAIDTIQRMLESGSPRDEAVEKALAIAADWMSQRAPGDQSEVKIDNGSIPDRAEIAPAELPVAPKTVAPKTGAPETVAPKTVAPKNSPDPARRS